MRNNAAYLPESPIVYIILPKSIRNRASLIIFGCGSYHTHFGLSDDVLITLITTTTANVIGIFVFVVKYLFNPKS